MAFPLCRSAMNARYRRAGIVSFLIVAAISVSAYGQDGKLGALRPGESIVVSPKGEVTLGQRSRKDAVEGRVSQQGLTIWLDDTGSLRYQAEPEPEVKSSPPGQKKRRYTRRRHYYRHPQRGTLTPPPE